MSDIPFVHQQDLIHPTRLISPQAYHQFMAALSYANDYPAMALINLRSCANVLVKSVYAELGFAPRAGLFNHLNTPYMQKAMPYDILQDLNTIRRWGNRAAHPEMQGVDSTMMGEWARKGLKYIYNAAAWYATHLKSHPTERLRTFEAPNTQYCDKLCGDAILRNDVEAQYQLGLLYHAKHRDLVMQWLKSTAKDLTEKDKSQAEIDLKHSFYWLNHAYETGQHVEAGYQAARALKEGHGVAQDSKRAFEIFEDCAAQGHLESRVSLGLALCLGADEPDYQRQADISKGLGLLQEVAAQDICSALNTMGEICFRGEFLPKDLKKAAEYWERALAQEDDHAAGKLGLLMVDGDYPHAGEIECAKLLQRGFESGDFCIAPSLYRIYNNRHSTLYDPKRAFYFLERASRYEEPESCYELALLYLKGGYCERNPFEALRLFDVVYNSKSTDPPLKRKALQGINAAFKRQYKHVSTYLRVHIGMRSLSAKTRAMCNMMVEAHGRYHVAASAAVLGKDYSIEHREAEVQAANQHFANFLDLRLRPDLMSVDTCRFMKTHFPKVFRKFDRLKAVLEPIRDLEQSILAAKATRRGRCSCGNQRCNQKCKTQSRALQSLLFAKGTYPRADRPTLSR